MSSGSSTLMWSDRYLSVYSCLVSSPWWWRLGSSAANIGLKILLVSQSVSKMRMSSMSGLCILAWNSCLKTRNFECKWTQVIKYYTNGFPKIQMLVPLWVMWVRWESKCPRICPSSYNLTAYVFVGLKMAVLEPWVSPAFAISFFLQYLTKRSIPPRWHFDPTSVEVTCVTLPKDHCIQVPWKYIKVCGYSDPFFKNLNQRSLTPRWPLTPSLLRPHVWLYHRIIVSTTHENTSKYVDTVTFFFFKNLNQRSLAPRKPLTPSLLRSHV